MTLSSVTYSQALIFLMSSLPNMRMLHLELRVSDLEQSLAIYTALNYAELGRVRDRVRQPDHDLAHPT